MSAIKNLTATEYRTAAKVLRTIAAEFAADRRAWPWLKRFWWNISHENDDEMLRKSGVLERMADIVDQAND